MSKSKDKDEEIKEILLESGIKVKPVYTPENIKDLNFNNEISQPGEYPFTRGVQPNMYRGRLWTIRQYAGFGTAEETNHRYR